jgi:hypothetical protein
MGPMGIQTGAVKCAVYQYIKCPLNKTMCLLQMKLRVFWGSVVLKPYNHIYLVV